MMNELEKRSKPKWLSGGVVAPLYGVIPDTPLPLGFNPQQDILECPIVYAAETVWKERVDRRQPDRFKSSTGIVAERRKGQRRKGER